jgi:hypothetical protein
LSEDSLGLFVWEVESGDSAGVSVASGGIGVEEGLNFWTENTSSPPEYIGSSGPADPRYVVLPFTLYLPVITDEVDRET